MPHNKKVLGLKLLSLTVHIHVWMGAWIQLTGCYTVMSWQLLKGSLLYYHLMHAGIRPSP